MVRFGSWMPANLRIKVFSIIVLQLQRQLCQEEGGKRVSTSTISIFRELDKMYCGVKKCLRSSCSHLEQTFSNNAYNAQLFTFWLITGNFRPNKLYPQLCCLAYLEQSIAANGSFSKRLLKLIDKSEIVNTRSMGFPQEWKNEPLWIING